MEHANLGQKTFLFFIARRSGFALAWFIALIAVVAFLDALPPSLQAYGNLLVFIGIVLFLLIAASTVGVALLEYRNFTISIYERNIKITRGILNRHEIGIPYKTIDRVDIIRTVVCQIFGVSNILIHIVPDDNPATKEEVFVLPFIEKGLAANIQKEIIEHSQVEHIKEINPAVSGQRFGQPPL